jgi:hypothetical protein
MENSELHRHPIRTIALGSFLGGLMLAGTALAIRLLWAWVQIIEIKPG